MLTHPVSQTEDRIGQNQLLDHSHMHISNGKHQTSVAVLQIEHITQLSILNHEPNCKIFRSESILYMVVKSMVVKNHKGYQLV